MILQFIQLYTCQETRFNIFISPNRMYGTKCEQIANNGIV